MPILPYPLVQAKGFPTLTSTASGAVVFSYDEDTTTGNFLVVYVGSREGATGDLSFTVSYNGTPMTAVGSSFAAAGAFADCGSLFYLENITGSATPDITITPSGTDTVNYNVILAEFYNVDTSSSLDVQLGTPTSVLVMPTTGTLAQAVELVVFGNRSRSPGVGLIPDPSFQVAVNDTIPGTGFIGLIFKMTNSTAAFIARSTSTGAANGSGSLATFRATAAPPIYSNYFDEFPKQPPRP